MTPKHLPLIYLAILLPLLAAAGCGRSAADRVLDRVDVVMDQHPDSALVMLEKIDSGSGLSRRQTMARYSLLMAEARYRNYVRDTSLSVLRPAISYYSNSDDLERRARTYYMAGLINIHAHRYGDAIISLLNASDNAEKIGDPLLLGRIYRSIADSYDAVCDEVSALKYYILSLEQFNKTDNIPYILFASLDVARMHYNSKDFSKSLSMARDVLGKAIRHNDSNAAAASLRLMAKSMSDLGNYRESIDTYDRLRQYDDLLPEDIVSIGMSYLYLGDADRAQDYEKILIEDGITDSWLSYLLMKQRGDSSGALSLLRDELDVYDEELLRLFNKDFASVLTGYYEEQQTAAHLRMSRQRQTFIFVAIIVVLVVTLTILFYRYRINALKMEDMRKLVRLKELNAEISGLNETLEEMERTETVIRSELDATRTEAHRAAESAKISAREESRQLLISRYALLDNLCQTYYKYNDRKKQTADIYAKVSEAISRLRSDATMLKEAEETINRHHDNILIYFRKDFPDLKPHEQLLYMLLVLRMSNTAISVLQDVTVESVYNRKSVLRKKIASSDSPRKEQYLELIK